MPDLIFHHKNLDRDLKIQTGANSIQWSYGLNTQTMPTYGGEVVQILSAYVDDITVQGDVKTYKKMEQIYKWFLQYIQTATQNNPGEPSFVETPIQMYYPERGWNLQLRVTSLPGFREATDITAPQYQISASVVEQDPAMQTYTMKQAAANGFDFSNISAGIGWDEDNPFTNPAASGSKYDPKQVTSRITDWYQNLIPSYLKGDFNDLFGDGYFGSKPLQDSSGGNNSGGGNQQQQDQGKGATSDAPSNGLPHNWAP